MTDSYNLLEEQWIPVRRQSGVRDWITPHQIAEMADAPVELDSLRPDFNGGLIQFLIGLLQTVYAPANEKGWRRLLENPPPPEELQVVLLKHQYAFNLLGDGPRFMQELDFPGDGVDALSVAQLLVGNPGAMTVKNNTDHFQKRGVVNRLSLSQAATALFTLQANASAGGVGYRTSLRGGGPLTTLMLGKNLWETVWLNVLPKSVLLERCEGDESQTPFPWCEPTRLSKKGESVQPAEVSPYTCFWGTPRRIRLSAPVEGGCGIEGNNGLCIESYKTLNYGNNYGEGYKHPLTPYSHLDKVKFPNPLKGKPTGLPYTEWPAMVAPVNVRRPAAVIEYALSNKRVRRVLKSSEVPRMWAFGFDMDNAKARGWQEAKTPLHLLSMPDDASPSELLRQYKQFGAVLGGWVEGASLAKKIATGCIGEALAHAARDKFKPAFWTAVTLDFWRQSEAHFYGHMGRLTDADVLGDLDAEQQLSQLWLGDLRSAAKAIFERYVPTEAGAVEQTPKRIALAHRNLNRALHGKKLAATVGVNLPKTKGDKA